ncbi:MAG: 3-deoxy-manno-octulosonate cytidylyltransferase [Candidatus Cloacimonetes bacterium]|nr:3-deoxy-manno-octulosonate cytidylyltransferase [Candidatus Cloacimonadota bacterium]
MKFIAVIPARFASVRFPGKPLATLKGKPIIQLVYEQVTGSGLFDNVIIATDDERIAEAVRNFGGSYQMTSPHHPSGSDRITEVVRDLDCDVVFNVQGDEPLIQKEPLALLKDAFNDKEVQVASLMTTITDEAELNNPNIVKIVTGSKSDALYFSRSPIPCNRDRIQDVEYYRHIGVYAYRKQTLLDFVKLPQSSLELTEKLEQLRLLENGIPIRMIKTSYQGIGIDTPEDLDKVILLI